MSWQDEQLAATRIRGDQMTDHRVTDLSYGHLGEASYDIDGKSWNFSRETTLDSSIQPLQPLQQCAPPSLRVLPSLTKTASKVRYSQEKWLQKALLEAGPARAIITSVIKTPTPASLPHHPSDLLAVGKAHDIDQTSGKRTTDIMAMVHGEAGNLLRLVKPRVEALKWDGQHDTKLRSLNPTNSEDCYWLGNGGAIQRITFGADNNGFTSWLAVLRAESITILRPIYHPVQIPSTISVNIGTRYLPSRLTPNPILSLCNERTGARPHADASFNPWYIRQFAVVDQKGYWSVWDIEGRKRKRTTFEAKPGKSGHIQDDSSLNQDFNSYDSADGWGRVLWAGGVSTLILCDRRSLVVFDLRAIPKRLYSPEVVRPRSTDWILDMKRSPINLHHIFVLTTRQIFWLQITEAGDDQDEHSSYIGAKLLLSCQHFWNQEDGTAKLELVGENEGCTALLNSAQSPLVNTYRFSMALGEPTRPMCSQGAFTVELSNKDRTEKSSGMIQTLCLLPTTFMLHKLKPMSGPAKEYADQNVRFYQLFGLGVTFGLYHCLCATRRTAIGRSNAKPIKYQSVLAPMIKDRRVQKFKSSLRVAEDQFVVPDGLEEDEDATESFSISNHTLRKPPALIGRHSTQQDGIVFTIDAHRLFRVSFLERELEGPKISTSSKPQNMAECSRIVQSGIEQRRDHGLQGLMTLFDLIGYASFSEDVDEAASVLRELMATLSSNAEAADTMTCTPLSIKPSLFIQFDHVSGRGKAMPDLSDVYDNLVDLWVSCLPRSTPGPARLAKEKLVRSVATELCLSSLGVFIHDKSVVIPELAELHEGIDLALPVRTKLDSVEQVDETLTQISSGAPVSNLPTPTTTPSLPPSDSTTRFEESVEDGAILRLRGYALSIKSQPPLGASRSAVLVHWPSAPGADPLKYSWEASHKAVAEDKDLVSDEEEALVRHRDQDRRRRRSEQFLKRPRVNTVDATSQPLPTVAFGSQPDLVQHFPSSQTVDVPMTQPDRGAFGSRLGKKRSKKRRTMGF